MLPSGYLEGTHRVSKYLFLFFFKNKKGYIELKHHKFFFCPELLNTGDEEFPGSVNRAHHEGWMVSGSGNNFLLGSSSLANHGGYLSCFFNYQPTY
jgi:hypothetical protein